MGFVVDKVAVQQNFFRAFWEKLSTHLSLETGTKRQLQAEVPTGLSLTLSQKATKTDCDLNPREVHSRSSIRSVALITAETFLCHVPTAWRVLGQRKEERPPAVNTLPAWELDVEITTPPHKQKPFYEVFNRLKLGRNLWISGLC
jgi:hypothetical protein